MTDWSGALARAFRQHLEIAGDGGSGGSRHEISKAERTLGSETSRGTTLPGIVVPRRGTTGTTAAADEVPDPLAEETQREQPSVRPGTTGTDGTSRETTHGSSSAFPVAAFEERAAIVEYDASVPRNWAEGFARLDLAERLAGIEPDTWRQLIDDGGRFLDRWGSEADQLGWSAVDVFGVRSAEPHGGYDIVGLALLIRGGDVVAIGPSRATIRTSTGMLLTYLRRTQPGAVPIWDLIEPTKEADHA
jgi:hypothetical protein